MPTSVIASLITSRAAGVRVSIAMLVAVFGVVAMAVLMTMRRVRNVRINQRAARVSWMMEFFFEPAHDAVESHAIAQIRKNKGMLAAHAAGVAVHHFQRSADVRSQVNLVDHQQIGTHDAGAALARNLLALGNVNHVNPDVHQLRAEGGGKIVSATFDENQREARQRVFEFRNRLQIHGRIFTDRGVRACARFDAANTFRGQPALTHQKSGIFRGVNVVGAESEIDARPKLARELVNERSLAGTDWSGNANAVRSGGISGEHRAGLLCAVRRSSFVVRFAVPLLRSNAVKYATDAGSVKRFLRARII